MTQRRSTGTGPKVKTERANRYAAHVFWSDEDNRFIALAPDVSGLLRLW
jgi:hypothetical protein